MFDDDRIDPACAVCERRLLPGERPIRFVTGDGAEVDVCELCKPRAEAAGWLRPEDVARTGANPVRERRRPRGAQILGGLIPRRGADPVEPAAETNRPASGRDDAGAMAPPPRDAPAAIDPSTSVTDALRAFNHSNHRRTVAGLSRTLGPPRASAVEIETGSGHPGVRLTIAWELTWYQWEVSPTEGGRGHDVRESGKGETIGQLRSSDRSWNLMVDVDGTLQPKAAASTEAVSEGT